MNRSARYCCLVFVTLHFLVVPIFAETAEELDAKYAKDRETAAWSSADKRNATFLSYTNALVALEKSFKADGELESVLAVREEKKLVDAAPAGGIPEGQTIQAIEDLRIKFRKALADIDLEEKKALVALAKRQEERLKALEKELTIADRIDDALAVRGKRTKVMEDPEVAAAVEAVKEAAAVPAESDDKAESASAEAKPAKSTKSTKVTKTTKDESTRSKTIAPINKFPSSTSKKKIGDASGNDDSFSGPRPY